MIRTHRAAAAVLTAALLAPATAACAPGGGSTAADARSAASSASTTSTASAPSGASDSTASGSSEAAAVKRGKHLSLPRPTGKWAVGRDTLHLVDKDRRDPWVPSAGARRLMVSVFYPARRGGPRQSAAPYMSAKEAGLLLKGLKLDKSFPPDLLASVRTHARIGARPAPGRHPLVVLSPGFTLHRATLTTLAEELTSHGYVVALLDHAYESFGTTFTPRGSAGAGKGSARTLTCVACETVEAAPDDKGEKKLLARAARNRAADISFAVDALTTPAPEHSRDYAELIDTRRIGAAGHSLGGNAAAVAAGTDRRIRAAADLDGTFFAPVPQAGLGRPILMLGTEDGHNPRAEDRTWPRTWQRLDGWKRWLTVADSGHFTFIDLPILGGQAGVTDPSAPLSGKRSGEITTQYVKAFFDSRLRGLHRPLLDGPSKENPEVTFHTP
ncbi:alpha/beta hydrolase [Streptomyces sp. 891-h]|uniref:alpha/beta hydrolase family protein n=1 Tax=unclassified Streptomyces TaxID=2593676 RepID=UPI001FAA6FA8|nr:alpha/beta hydrolase [Streptomyces sp. 891-h]UNZ16089.1 alpha/beta hydrolase [Streptomyces sp. 891-h]